MIKEKTSLKTLFKIGDILSLFLAVGVAFCTGYYVYGGGFKQPAMVEITAKMGESLYSIDKNRHVPVKGSLGDSIIVIEDGKAFFNDSPCPDKLCVKAGEIHTSGQWAGCLPNQIFIRIIGETAEKNSTYQMGGGDNYDIDSLSF